MKTKLKTLIWVIVLWFVLFFLIAPDSVFAAAAAWWWGVGESKSSALEAAAEMFTKLLQWLYAATWPLLVIAGKFMTNQVIYGEIFGLDKIMWWMWNMIRSFANYFLWIVFILSIFFYMLQIKNEKYNPFKILPQIVVASLLVNSSWFIIWVLLDLSTILTFGVWTLPMKIWAEQNEQENSRKLMPKIDVILDTNNKFFFEAKIAGEKVCSFQNGKAKEACVAFGWWCYKKYSTGLQYGDPTAPCITDGIDINTLLKDQKDMTGPLVSIYTSFVDSASVVSNQQQNMWWYMVVIALIKILILLALIVPLFTLALILIFRAVVLWVLIPISPIIFLVFALPWFKLIDDKYNLKEVVSLIFIPPIVVFALSISMIFMTWVAMPSKNMPEKHKDAKCNPNNDSAMACALWVVSKWNGNQIELDMWWKWNDNKILLTFETPESSGWWWWDIWNLLVFFSWIVWNIFGIAFMWVIVKAAMEHSKITGKIAWWTFSVAQEMIKSAPIIPGTQSISSLGHSMRYLETKPDSIASQQFSQLLKPKLDEMKNKATWAESKALTKANTEAEGMVSTTDLTKPAEVAKTNKTANLAKTTKVWWTDTEVELNNLTIAQMREKGVLEDVASKLWISKERLSSQIATHKATDKLSDINLDNIYDEEISNPIDEAKKNLKKYIDDNTKILTFPEAWTGMTTAAKAKVWDYFKHACALEQTTPQPDNFDHDYWESEIWQKIVIWLMDTELYWETASALEPIIAAEKKWNQVMGDEKKFVSELITKVKWWEPHKLLQKAKKEWSKKIEDLDSTFKTKIDTFFGKPDPTVTTPAAWATASTIKDAITIIETVMTPERKYYLYWQWRTVEELKAKSIDQKYRLFARWWMRIMTHLDDKHVEKKEVDIVWKWSSNAKWGYLPPEGKYYDALNADIASSWLTSELYGGKMHIKEV